jgi:hypothetical protein
VITIGRVGIRDIQSLEEAAVRNFSVDRIDSLGRLVILLTILRPNGLAPKSDFVTLDRLPLPRDTVLLLFSIKIRSTGFVGGSTDFRPRQARLNVRHNAIRSAHVSKRRLMSAKTWRFMPP